MHPANGGNAAQPPLPEVACVQALADLAAVNTAVQKAINQSSLPAELGTSLRYVIFLSLLLFDQFNAIIGFLSFSLCVHIVLSIYHLTLFFPFLCAPWQCSDFRYRGTSFS